MKLIKSEAYEEIGAEFQFQITSLLNQKLAALNLDEATRKKVCEEFIFDCSMLFDQQPLNVESNRYQVKICFVKEDKLFIPNDAFSYHEYAFGIVDEIF